MRIDEHDNEACHRMEESLVSLVTYITKYGARRADIVSGKVEYIYFTTQVMYVVIIISKKALIKEKLRL